MQTNNHDKLEGHSVQRMYLRQRPKSKNWASLMPHSSATVRCTENSTDPGNSLALGLQRGVNSISLQCIPWPVACSEWGACLTDFDRSSTFRFRHPDYDPDRVQKLISSSMSRHAKFHPNQCTRFWVILLTDDRQTDKHRGELHIPPPLSKVNYTRRPVIWNSAHASSHVGTGCTSAKPPGQVDTTYSNSAFQQDIQCYT